MGLVDVGVDFVVGELRLGFLVIFRFVTVGEGALDGEFTSADAGLLLLADGVTLGYWRTTIPSTALLD